MEERKDFLNSIIVKEETLRENEKKRCKEMFSTLLRGLSQEEAEKAQLASDVIINGEESAPITSVITDPKSSELWGIKPAWVRNQDSKKEVENMGFTAIYPLELEDYMIPDGKKKFYEAKSQCPIFLLNGLKPTKELALYVHDFLLGLYKDITGYSITPNPYRNENNETPSITIPGLELQGFEGDAKKKVIDTYKLLGFDVELDEEKEIVVHTEPRAINNEIQQDDKNMDER